MTRRLLSFATLLFFAQLSLVGEVAKCWLAASGSHAAHATVATGHEGGHGDASSHDAGKGGDRVPGCATTSMCVVVMMPPLVASDADSPTPEHAPTALVPTTPLSITQAPELPPPRG